MLPAKREETHRQRSDLAEDRGELSRERVLRILTSEFFTWTARDALEIFGTSRTLRRPEFRELRRKLVRDGAENISEMSVLHFRIQR